MVACRRQQHRLWQPQCQPQWSRQRCRSPSRCHGLIWRWASTRPARTMWPPSLCLARTPCGGLPAILSPGRLWTISGTVLSAMPPIDLPLPLFLLQTGSLTQAGCLNTWASWHVMRDIAASSTAGALPACNRLCIACFVRPPGERRYQVKVVKQAVLGLLKRHPCALSHLVPGVPCNSLLRSPACLHGTLIMRKSGIPAQSRKLYLASSGEDSACKKLCLQVCVRVQWWLPSAAVLGDVCAPAQRDVCSLPHARGATVCQLARVRAGHHCQGAREMGSQHAV